MANRNVIHQEDLRIAMSHLAQTVYGTALTAANLLAGKSFRPSGPLLPEIARQFLREGPLGFSGVEFAREETMFEVRRDVRVALAFSPLNSYLAAWGPAFILQGVTSVLEGATGHYTHTIKPSVAVTSGRQAKVTSIYIEATGPDADRRKAIYPSLAVERFSISARMGDFIQCAIDLLGSGVEDAATAVTLPALSTEVPFSGQNYKFEIGDQGGALTDITELVSEWSLELAQQLAAERGYVPNATTPASGKFRSQMQFTRRTPAFNFRVDIDRATPQTVGSIRQRYMLSTKTEIKVTVDSGVVAGTGAKNHGFEIRIPSCRLMVGDPSFDDMGAFYSVSVPSEKIYLDGAIADSPIKITVENDQVSYLV